MSNLPRHFDSYSVSSSSRSSILLMEKSVSFWWRKTGIKYGARIAELDDKSRDFLELIELTREPTDLKS